MLNGGFALRNTCALLCAWLSFAVVSNHAQSQTFKGHHIGESFSDFLKAEPAIQEKLTYCQTTTPHQLSPDEITKLSPEELRSRYGAWAKTFKQYLKIESNYSKNGNKEQEQKEYLSKCEALLNFAAKGDGLINGTGDAGIGLKGFESPGGSLVGISVYIRNSIDNLTAANVDEYHRYFSFRNNQLVSFSQDLRAAYDSAQDDITKRMGVKPALKTVPYHNAFGATWTSVTAAWDNDSIHAELLKDDNPAQDMLPYFSVETQGLHKQFLESRQNAPKPLD